MAFQHKDTSILVARRAAASHGLQKIKLTRLTSDACECVLCEKLHQLLFFVSTTLQGQNHSPRLLCLAKISEVTGLMSCFKCQQRGVTGRLLGSCLMAFVDLNTVRPWRS